jgi:two-component system chemotaxis sensor kinase CheA
MSAAPDRDRESVQLFIEESMDALQRMEHSLLEAEAGRAPVDLMRMLFQDIHTLKGSAACLAYKPTQRLAHEVEDLLAKLRDEVIAPRSHHFALLLSAGDLLRHMLCSIRQTGEDDSAEVGALAAALTAALIAAQADDAQAASVAAAPITARASADQPFTSADSTVRVNVADLDRLMNLIDELVQARNHLIERMHTREDSDMQSMAACERLNTVASQMQVQIMKTRLQPVARVFEDLPRLARDLCHSLHKQVVTRIEGTAAGIDKVLAQAIRDPVMHVVRNAIDHGIELPDERLLAGKRLFGTLRISAWHEGSTIAIDIDDDGRGLDAAELRSHAVRKGLLSPDTAENLTDREALDLIFRPGFSTAKAVTDISGRGVGMDVVRTQIVKAGGRVELSSLPGRGTTVRFTMPLTLASIPALLIRSGGQLFAIAQAALCELVSIDAAHSTAAIYRLRGRILPLVNLARALGLPQRQAGGVHIVVVSVGLCRFGLVVDQILDLAEVVIRPVDVTRRRLSCCAGVSSLSDGGVASVLDVAAVAALAAIDLTARQSDTAVAPTARVGSTKPYVLFDAGQDARCAVPVSMIARLEEIPARAIQQLAGVDVVQLREGILPIVRLEPMPAISGRWAPAGLQPLLVFDSPRRICMAVNRIIDIVEVDVDTIRNRGDHPYALGQAAIAGITTWVVDVPAWMRRVAPDAADQTRSAA